VVSSAVKSKYVPDLKAYGRTCEINYVAIMKLVPELKQVGSRYEIAADPGHNYRLVVLEVSRYTNLVEISLHNENMPSCLMPMLKVRLYHDARMAEVCATQQIYHFRSRYDYPNRQMLQSDEKYQVNQFLGEWLRFCINHGYYAENIVGR